MPRIASIKMNMNFFLNVKEWTIRDQLLFKSERGG